jgi:hypothetical protein
MSSYLTEVAKQKKQQWINYRNESRSERKNWEKKVKELYTQIKQWLMPLETDGLLRYKEERLPVNSILLGEGIEQEMRDELTIEFFNGETIKLEPTGLEVVGAYGRVDMKLGLHQVMIVMQEKEGDWIFAERYNREEPTLYDFNQTNFEQFVTDFVERF